MRKGSNFIGTDEELLNAMKENLIKYTSNPDWLNKMKESKSKQDFINICESLAECVDNGYLSDISYNVYADKTMMFHPNKMTCTIAPEGTSEKELEKLRKDINYNPYELTKAGKDFLNL